MKKLSLFQDFLSRTDSSGEWIGKKTGKYSVFFR